MLGLHWRQTDGRIPLRGAGHLSQITLDLPNEALLALKLSPQAMGETLRMAAANEAL
jgi:hypothetical protein